MRAGWLLQFFDFIYFPVKKTLYKDRKRLKYLDFLLIIWQVIQVIAYSIMSKYDERSDD